MRGAGVVGLVVGFEVEFRHAKWNISKICWTNFTYSFEIDPTENVWKGEAHSKQLGEQQTFCLSCSKQTYLIFNFLRSQLATAQGFLLLLG